MQELLAVGQRLTGCDFRLATAAQPVQGHGRDHAESAASGAGQISACDSLRIFITTQPAQDICQDFQSGQLDLPHLGETEEATKRRLRVTEWSSEVSGLGSRRK